MDANSSGCSHQYAGNSVSDTGDRMTGRGSAVPSKRVGVRCTEMGCEDVTLGAESPLPSYNPAQHRGRRAPSPGTFHTVHSEDARGNVRRTHTAARSWTRDPPSSERAT
jgi:hypothetical protein